MATQHVTDQDFEAQVTAKSGYVLVDFWAEWCGPCRQLAPILDQLSEELAGTVTIAKMDIDKNPEAPTRHGVRSIPTLILFKDGKPVATKVGSLPKSQLKDWLTSAAAA